MYKNLKEVIKMSKTVIGVFTSRDQAEKAVAELRNIGFEKEISILAKDDDTYSGTDHNSVIADGATTGGVIGGIAGLAIGVGALAIPGLGPIIAAGPIAGMLSGAATGGVAGGLVDWGIPEERSKYYENRVKEGNIVATIKTSDDRINSAADVLRKNGAQDVETH